MKATNALLKPIHPLPAKKDNFNKLIHSATLDDVNEVSAPKRMSI